MAIDTRFEFSSKKLMRDTRPLTVRVFEAMRKPENAAATFWGAGFFVAVNPMLHVFADIVLFAMLGYAWWLWTRPVKTPYRMPKYNKADKKSDGILFIGNQRKTNLEMWVSNSDARTHTLYLGTTGSGKTEGLKSLVSNALTWGSGFVYVDGKADTDLWATMYAMARRFGRDDDLLLLNYMTGNSDDSASSNTMNPFSLGSASYLSNMMVGLMAESGGDNAMWKDRAISLLSALMPALTYKRDHEGLLLDVGVIRDSLGMEDIVRLSRDPNMPERITRGLKGYLNTLPGFAGEAFNDDGTDKPNSNADMTVPRQQHGYLSMQFTRSLQSLADEYGSIFKTQLADIDMVDVVLQRRIMLVLIPALEKSGDEAANLGKIIAASIKGMMGSTLGVGVEGDTEAIIENKPTRSNSPFLTVFDEVGYYAAQGMAVMAAQARSLGFGLIFAAQDLPALEKRVKEEARSITANCNIKIFGKLEDPTQTKEFFENTVGGATISKITSTEGQAGSVFGNYREGLNTSYSDVKKASYGELKGQKEGQAHIHFMADTLEADMFYANPKRVAAVRVQKLLRVSPKLNNEALKDPAVNEILKRFRDNQWLPARDLPDAETVPEIGVMLDGLNKALANDQDWVSASALALTHLAADMGLLKKDDDDDDDDNMLSLDSLMGGGDKDNKPKPMFSLDKDDEPAAAPAPKALSWADLLGGTEPKTPTPPPAAAAPQKPAVKEDALSMDALFGAPAASPVADSVVVEAGGDQDAAPDSDDAEMPDLSAFFAELMKSADTDTDDAASPSAALVADTPVSPAAPAAPVAAQPPTAPRGKIEKTTEQTPIIDDELVAPSQNMTPFMAEIMKRAGSSLGKGLSAPEDKDKEK